MVVSGAFFRGVALVTTPGEIAFDGRVGLREGAMSPSGLRLVSRSGRHALSIVVSPLGQAAICSEAGVLLGVRAC